jgi:regulator of replication initiation timing
MNNETFDYINEGDRAKDVDFDIKEIESRLHELMTENASLLVEEQKII